ncbi:hypothetical protein F5884DRAFT_686806 [Xylogone sp. PMI_703]|nr:hypothetical protein F5884DRAFT_686806 [Xylogone sp. PMI_703]
MKLLDEVLPRSQEEVVVTISVRNPGNLITMAFSDHNLGLQIGIINGEVSGVSFGEE